MAEVDEQALQQELSGVLAPAAETGSEAQPDIEMFEIPVGEQTYKIPVNTELPIKHNGQIVKAPLEKVLNAFRERSNLQDKYGQLKTERAEFDQKMADYENFEQLKQKYGAIQDWSEKNPEQWERLWQMYENKDKHLLSEEGQESNALVQEVVNLKKELGELRQFKEELTAKEREAQESADVKTVEEDIAKFRKDYSNIDLDKANGEGVSLKAQILKHGIDNDLPTFRSAALSYLESDLFKAAERKGREETVKAVQKDKQEGILGRSRTPFSEKGDFNPLEMEEDDRSEAALAELQSILGKQ